MQERVNALSLEQVLTIVRRRAVVIVLCFVVVTVGTYVISKQQTKRYTATASLVFNGNQVNQQVAGLPALVSSDPTTQQATDLQLVKLGQTASLTARAIGRGLTRTAISNNIDVNQQGASNIVDVSATSTSPRMAALIANTYTTQFVSSQLSATQQYFASALALVNRQLSALSPEQRAAPQGLALLDRKQSLAILAHLQAGTVQVAQTAPVPRSPSSPKVLRNTALGALLGLVLGLGIAFLLERLDRRIREPRDLERIYDLPLLAVIPASQALSQHTDDPGGARRALPAAEAEAFQLLRAHLRYFNVDRDVRVLVVVSSAPGDGKTTVARNLAEAAAMMGSRALLIEADLRRPSLGKRLSITSSPGLTGALIGAAPLSEAVSTVQILPRSADRGSSPVCSVDVLIAGAVAPPNPAAMIESKAMRDLLAEARSKYELVVIDSPPLTAVSDAFPLLPQADGVIIVGRMGRNRRDVANRMHEVLKGIDAELLGVVANDFKQTSMDSYGYAYRYGYGYGYGEGSAGAASTNGNESEAASTRVSRE